MAVFPCDFDGHRYPGPQRTAYPALVDGTSVERSKLRLCQTHFNQVVEFCEGFMFDADHPDMPSGCARCDRPDAHYAAYVTLYDHGAERRDLYAALCEAHAVPLLVGVKNGL